MPDNHADLNVLRSCNLILCADFGDFVYFGRFPACFGPFRKVQSLSTLEILQSAIDPAIDSYAQIYHGNNLGAVFDA